MTKRVSLKDIAKKAGVSTATVSYVLSKRENSGISAGVSSKIKKIAKDLNYRPNQIAKSLQSGKTFTLGLIVADISNPFFGHLARIIEDGAKKYGYTVIFGSSDENAPKSADLIQLLIEQAGGRIYNRTGGRFGKGDQTPQEPEHSLRAHRPFFPENQDQLCSLWTITKAAYEATSRLIETGNKAIGMVAYSGKLHHMKGPDQGI